MKNYTICIFQNLDYLDDDATTTYVPTYMKSAFELYIGAYHKTYWVGLIWGCGRRSTHW